MEVPPPLRFDDTEVAFSYKSDKELKKANFIFTVVNYSWISSLATHAVKFAFWLHLPIKGMIRKTVFSHFCGGETIGRCDSMIHKLAEFKVGTILDYSVEGAETEHGFDETTLEILRTFDRAAADTSIPFCVFKVTGMATMDLLERAAHPDTMTDQEKKDFEKVRERVDRICAKAFQTGVPVLIDAEDSWIQDAIDRLATEMMQKYNGPRAIIFNTFQMYRKDMLNNLTEAHRHALANGYHLGVKMVRGAYMEKERARATAMNYPDPIHADKQGTDNMFNKGLAYCLEHHDRIALVCGSHNEYSNALLAESLPKYQIQSGDKKIWFAQLLGMSDNISFNLAKKGYRVAKYVPYGPVEAVMPYLLRRASENTSVAGQSSRELLLIRKELKRRKSR